MALKRTKIGTNIDASLIEAILARARDVADDTHRRRVWVGDPDAGGRLVFLTADDQDALDRLCRPLPRA